MKKNITGILVAVAILTLACLCFPANINSYRSTPAAAPPRRSIPFTSATIPAPSVSACAQDLEQVLKESEDAIITGGPRLTKDYTLVTYKVDGDTIKDPVYDTVPVNLENYQHNTLAHQKIWDFFTGVIPVDQRTMVADFVLYTDGASESLGAVQQTDDPQDWMFEMDLIDGGNFPDLATTVIHEFAHLLTLNDSQVTTDFPVFEAFDNHQIFDREAALCPNYFIQEGCSNPDSYLNTFFYRFWPDIFAEWQAINAETDQDLLDQALSHFYQKYTGQFVSEYAATSPSEDVAETFMYFIFVPIPTSTTIAAQKILFFYEYPELVALRGRILDHLCLFLPKP